MKVIKRSLFLICLFVSCFLFVGQSFAAAPANPSKVEEMKAKVVSVSDSSKEEVLQIKVLDGSEKDKTIKVSYDLQGLASLKFKNGQTIILSKQTDASGKIQYGVNDKFRLPYVGIALVLFLILVVLIAGRKGIGSIIGLGISLAIIFLFIIPNILSGHNPLAIAMMGSIAILLFTTYIAHGVSRQTTIALVSTLSALILTWIIATFVLDFTLLSGFGTEEAYTLHMGLKNLIDFKGLLLAGIIIATLGALNDVTTTQAAAIFEIHKASPKLDFDELLVKGMNVGREHVASLVNTLVLAFVGSSLVLFLVYFFNPSGESITTILNSEIISEEIIKTIVGTSGLLLSMPIVTVLATFVCVNVIGDNHK